MSLSYSRHCTLHLFWLRVPLLPVSAHLHAPVCVPIPLSDDLSGSVFISTSLFPLPHKPPVFLLLCTLHLSFSLFLSFPFPRLTLRFPQFLHQTLSLLLNQLLHTPLPIPKVSQGGQRELPKGLPAFPVGKDHTWGIDRHGLQRKLEGNSGSLSTPYPPFPDSPSPTPILHPPPPPGAYEALTISLEGLIKNGNFPPTREGLRLAQQGLPNGLCPT